MRDPLSSRVWQTVAWKMFGGQSSALFDFFDAALHVKVAFGHFVVFAVQDFLEAANGFGNGNLFTGPPREHLRDTEGLAEKALNFARPKHGKFVLGRELVHAENRNDVLQVLVALEDALDTAGHIIMFVADNFGGQGAGGRG